MYSLEEVSRQKRMEKAHADAYEYTVQYVERHILAGLQVMQLSHLCLLYRGKLDETEFENQEYRSEKLMVTNIHICMQYSTSL